MFSLVYSFFCLDSLHPNTCIISSSGLQIVNDVFPRCFRSWSSCLVWWHSLSISPSSGLSATRRQSRILHHVQCYFSCMQARQFSTDLWKSANLFVQGVNLFASWIWLGMHKTSPPCMYACCDLHFT